MIQNFIELYKELMKLKTEPKKTAVVKAANKHTLESVFELAKEGLIMPYLIDDEEAINRELLKVDTMGVPYVIVHAETDSEAAFKGVQMAKENQVDFIMKGDLQTGILLKEVVNHDRGIREKKVLSHLALIEVPGYPRLIGVTDGGMVLTPTIEQKKQLFRML